ncbi:MAG TPA: hypothetical protein VMM56_10740 [Planctomycetaceae bacterium]|nr:hypothetical protein [Planctomycetaceae bacterium]
MTLFNALMFASSILSPGEAIIHASVPIAQQVIQSNLKELAIHRIRACGGEVFFEHQWAAPGVWRPDAKLPGDPRLCFLLGKHYAAHPVEVQLFASGDNHPEQFTDLDAVLLMTFTKVRWLVLFDTSITDASLPFIRHCRALERLDVEGTKITQAGAEQLKQQSIRRLDVYGDFATDDQAP